MGKNAASRKQGPSPEERRLVWRARRGSLVAYQQLIRLAFGQVAEFLLWMDAQRTPERVLKDAEDAFFASFPSLKEKPRKTTFGDWILGKAVETATERRSGRAQPAAETGSAESQSAMGALLFVEAADRAILILSDRMGFAEDRVAGITRMPAGTVRTRLNRARLVLRDRLDRAGCLPDRDP